MSKKKQPESQPRQLTGHQKLERRRLLNADFDFTGGVLELSNFVDDDAALANDVLLTQTGVNTYEITLTDGVFTGGTDTAEVSGLGTNVLSLNNSPLMPGAPNPISSILLQSNDDVFDIQFGDFEFDGDITVEQGGTVAFDSITQTAGTSLESTGTLTITGADNIALDNTVGNDLGNIDIQNADSVSIAEINDVDFTTIAVSGDVTVESDGNVTLNNAAIGGDLEIETTSGDINVDATGALTLDQISTDDGSVDISTTDDIEIGSVSATAALPVDGTIDIDSTGGSINDLQDDSLVDIQASGIIQLNAADEIGGMPLIGTATDSAGRLELAAGSVLELTSTGGDIVIAGVGDLVLADLDAVAVDVFAAGDVTITSVIADTTASITADGEIIDGGDADTDIVADTATLTASNGIGSADQIELEVDSVSAMNSTAGDIDLLQVAAGGDIAVSGLSNSATNGDITLSTVDGTIDVGGTGVSGVNGDVSLTAMGAGSNVEINSGVTTSGGDVDIDAEDDVNFSAAGDVSTAGGDVSVSADFDSDGNGLITMADGAAIDAGSGTITLEADEDITLGGLSANNVNVTSNSGGIIDGGNADTDIVADTATLTASNGIGSADQIELEVDSVSATNSTAGDIDLLQEAAGGDIVLQNISAGSGAVDVVAANDVLVGSVEADTTIDITSDGGSINDLDDDLAVDLAAGGSITLTAQDEIGGIVPAGSATDADQKLELAAGSQVSATSASSDIEIRGLGDITLDTIDATNGVVNVMAAGDVLVGSVTADILIEISTTSGSINDLQDDLADDLSADSIVLNATDEIGSGALANAVDAVGKLEVADGSILEATSTNGDVAIRGTGSLIIDDIQAAGTANVIAADDISVGEVTAVDGIFTGAGTDGTGAITLDGNVTTTSAIGRVLLESAGAVVQNSGAITTNGLLLDGGSYTLTGNNLVDNLAADSTGDINFTNSAELTIASLTFSSVCITRTISGISTVGDLNLTTNDTDILQDDDAPLSVGGNATFDAGTGNICLTNVNNVITGDVTLINTGEVVLAIDGDLSLTASLVSGGGSLQFIADRITITTDIVANQLLLEASDGVELIDAFFIDVTDLLLVGTGDFELVNTGGNVIDNLAADIVGNLEINNSSDLNFGTLTFASGCGDATISGVNVDAGAGLVGDFDVSTTNSDITQSAAVTVEGATTLDTGAGNINLNGADRSSERTGSVEDTTNSTVTSDGLNDNDFGQIDATGNSVEIIDVNDLNVVDITVVEDIFLRTGDTNLSSGTLNLNGNVTTSDPTGQVLLQSDNGVMQNSGGITANDLLLGGNAADEGAGAFSLTGTNQVNNLAASLQDSLEFTNTDDLKIDSVTYLSDIGTTETHAGITTTDDVNLLIDGNLTIQQSVELGDGNLLLGVDGDASQITTGTINSAGLALQVNGTTILNEANDVDVLTVDNNGATQLSNANDLKIGDVNANGVSVAGAATADADLALAVGGNLTFEQQVNLGDGDLFLDVDGDVSQIVAGTIDAAGLGLMVDGETVLNEANDIDVLAVNNQGATHVSDTDDLKTGFVNVEAVSADRAMAVINGTVDAATMSLTGITASDDDVKLTAGGNLTLEESVNLGEGDLFLDVNGDASQLTGGTIDAAGLGLMVEGQTLLNEANDIDVLATNNNGATQVSDSNDLKVGTVTAEAVSANRAMQAMNGSIDVSATSLTGVTTSDDDVKITTTGNLTLEESVNLGEGDLFLDVDGDVSQLADGTIDAAGLGLMVEGQTVLNEANDIDVLAAVNNGATQLNDVNDLKVGTVTADAVTAGRAMAAINGSITAPPTSIAGITTSDDDVKLTAAGNLTLEQTVNLSEGDLLLDVDGDVTQLATGTIDAAGLGLMIEGQTVLNEANDIDVLAANNNEATQVNNINDLKVGTVTAEAVSADRAMTAMNGSVDAAATSIIGITSSDDDVKLSATGNLTLEESVNLSQGDLLLDVDGDVSQTATGTIDAAGLGLMVEGETVLNEANDIDVLATNNNGATQVNDINDLKVGIVTAEAVSADRAMAAMNGSIDAVAMSLTGVTTSDDDVKLTAAGNLTLEEIVSLGEGDLLLDVDGDVSQIADGTIDAAGLGLMVEGETLLNEANDIDILAANNNGATQFGDINDLKVGSVIAEAVSADRAMAAMNGSFDSASTSITGITSSDDDVKLTAAGNVTLEEAVNLNEGDLFLDGDGDVSQLATGTIDAAGLGLMVVGETVLNEANDIDVVATNNSGATQVNDINDLKIGSVSAEAVSADRAMTAMNGTIEAASMSISGVTSPNEDVKLAAGGNVTLEEAVNIGTGDLLLDVDGDASQLAAGTIDAAGLGLMVDGETVLNAANEIDVLAADNNGATHVNNANDLKVGTVTSEAVSADRAMAAMNGTVDAATMFVTGITTSNDDVKLAAVGNATLEEAVNAGTGDVFLEVDGDVAQLATGTIDAFGLGLMVEGETVLNAANEVDVLAANNNGATQVNDIDSLAIGTVTAEAVSADRAMAAMNGAIDVGSVSITGVTTSDDDIKLTTGSNLSIDQAVNVGTGDLFVDAGGNVTQEVAGMIDASGLGLMVTGQTVLNNVANDVDTLAANNDGGTQYTDANSVTVGTVTLEAVSADRAMAAMNGSVVSTPMVAQGITTSADDVKLTASGDIDLAESVNLGTGDLLIDSDGTVTQQAAGSVQAGGLGLMVTGETILNNVDNDVDRIAAGNIGNHGAIQYIDADDLTVGVVIVEALAADPATVEMTLTGITVDSVMGTTLVNPNYTSQIELLDDTIQTQQLGGEPIFNPVFDEYLTGLGATNDGDATAVGVALLSAGELRVSQEIVSASDVFLTNTDGDVSIDQNIGTSDAVDKILIVAAEELNLNAQLERGLLSDSVVSDVSNLNPTLLTPALLLDPSDDSQELALIDPDTFTQFFEYTFGQPGEQNFTTTVFFGVALDAYSPLSVLAQDFPVLDFVAPETLNDLNELLFELGSEDFESRSLFQDSLGGQISITNESQPINGPNDLLPPSTATVFPATASFTFEFLNANPEFRNVAFVFNDAGINIFENAAGTTEGLRDLNVAVEDFQGIANIGTPPVIDVQREEIEIAGRVEITTVTETEFFQSVVIADEPLFTQTVQEKFFVVVYFESQAEADNFEASFEKLETSETGERDYDQLRELLKKFESLDFRTDDENEALDVNKIRQIFEKAELDIDGDDDEWQEAFQKWLERKEFDNESPEVPRGVYKIIEVENGKAIIQGDDVDRRFVPEPNDQLQTEDYPFEVPSEGANGGEPDGDPLQLKPAADIQNDGANLQPISARMTRWAAMLEGQSVTGETEVSNTDLPTSFAENPALPSSTVAATTTVSAMGLLGIVVQRNAANNRTAAAEIEDFAKAKAKQPERNIFSKAARFFRRNQQALRDDNQD